MRFEEITAGSDPDEDNMGFADIFLKIVDTQKTDYSYRYTAKELFEGNMVGAQIEIESDIPNIFTPDGKLITENGVVRSVRNGVKIRSIGAQSDALAQAMDARYCESFLNINTGEPVIVLCEEDEEYRAPVCMVFTGQQA
jgi:hypothetical protein